jgi:hypothetical protein
MRSIIAKLMPASRHQDHTTWPSASRAFVFARIKRPPHPAPNVRDDRETPLLIGHGMRKILLVIWGSDQPRDLRRIGTTGKSGVAAEIQSSEEQLLFFVIPGCAEGADPESMAQHERLEKWIPGSALRAAPE